MEISSKTAGKERIDLNFVDVVEQRSGKQLQQCYQCFKCSAGCPVAFAMDWAPNQIIRMIQLGLRDKVLSSTTIWICAACEACVTRCPNEVDLPVFMDSLKAMAIEEGINSEAAHIATFHRVFLSCVREYGRLHEISLLAAYKVLSLNMFKEDMVLGALMFAKGKLRILPTRIENIDEIEQIFETFGTNPVRSQRLTSNGEKKG